MDIHEKIACARTPDGALYHDASVFAAQKERIFARAWHLLPEAGRVRAPGHVLPLTLLEGCLDEPVVLSCADDGELHCLSNVCTHRGAIVVEGEGHLRGLRCRYHGRRFALDGTMTFMPEFEGVMDFPAPSDNLPRLHTERWGPFVFASLEPAVSFADWIAPVRRRVDWLPLDRLVFDPATSRDYHLHANWALYTENFLEEFHLPYVHGASLSGTLDYDAYRTELDDWGSVQVGIAKEGEPGFELPAGHPDAGQRVCAWYFWLFPNLMLNIYPWGVSVNIVQPLGPERTRVSFLSWVLDARRRGEGAGADLHRVEMEDEEIVESAHRGVRSRLYIGGRYSPRRESGTHHFHRLLAKVLRESSS